MKITQASIQTLAILGAVKATNAASLRGSKEEETVIFPPLDSHHHHVAGKGLGDPDDHVVAYQARRGGDGVPIHFGDEQKKGRIVPRHITLAVKNDEELNKLLGGTKKNGEPDHMMAYASSGGYGIKHGRIEAPAPSNPALSLSSQTFIEPNICTCMPYDCDCCDAGCGIIRECKDWGCF